MPLTWPEMLEEGERLHAHLIQHYEEMIEERMAWDATVLTKKKKKNPTDPFKPPPSPPLQPFPRPRIPRQGHPRIDIPLKCGKNCDHIPVLFCIGLTPC